MGELQRDSIDRIVPVWPEQCQKCLRDNKIGPATAVMCPDRMRIARHTVVDYRKELFIHFGTHSRRKMFERLAEEYNG